MANTSSFSSSLFPPSSVRHRSSFDDADFFDPAILPSGKGNQTNGFSNTIFEARPTSTPGLNTVDDESRFWLMMQQSTPTHQDPKFSQIFAPQIPPSQQELSFAGRHKVNGMSGLDDVYGFSSRLVDEHQNCDPSFFTQMPQQKYANGHVSNSNGYLHSLDEVQHKGESGLAEFQRNERIGVNYFPGYGDLMFSSGDVYTRVFGL